MFDILLILYLGHITHISTSKRIQCATTIEKSAVKLVTCEPKVEFCLTVLERKTVDVPYLQQPLGCMQWDELVLRCPSTTGVCHILHGDYERVRNTCCCRGSMCNNRTLPLVIAEDSSDPTIALSGNLAKFGVMQRSMNMGSLSSMVNHTTDRTVLIYSLSIGTVFIFVVISLCFVLTIKYGSGESSVNKLSSWFCFKRKLDSTSTTTEMSCQNGGQSHSFTAKTRRRSLINRMLLPSPTSTTTPLLMSDETVGMSNSHLYSIPGDIPYYKLTYSSSVGDIAKLHSAEKLAMQHIVECCQKVRLLGHGRFAKVWLASVPDSAIRQAVSQFNGIVKPSTAEKGGEATSSGHPEQTGDTANWSTVSAGDNYDQLKELADHPLPSQATTTQESLSDHMPCVSEQAENDTTIHLNPDESNDVAIKIFPANDFKSWSAELSIFRALQEPLGQRLLSISDAETPSFYHLLCEQSGVLPAAATCPVNCPTVTSAGSTLKSTGPENADSNVSGCCPPSQPRHANLIQMIAAGVINEENDDATPVRLVREHHLVLEYAAGGSLSSLLSSCQWLSTSRMLQISRDIARGLAFLHSDVSYERSAARGSLAKLPIAHRDLKPENILLRANGIACLSDFGQATMVTDATPECHRQYPGQNCQNLAGEVTKGSSPSNSYWSDVFSSKASQSPSTAVYYGHCSLDCMPQAGTLRYMAPELLDGAINFTGSSLLRTDIYSLGLVLWEVMTAVYVPDHQQLVPRLGPSRARQVETGQLPGQSVADGKQGSPGHLLPSENEEEEEETTLGTDLSVMSQVAGWEVFGQGFRMLVNDWQSGSTPSARTLQRHHSPPPPPLDSVGLRENHRLPYELELESASSTARYYQQQPEEHAGQSTLLLRQLVVVDKYRPMANYLWTYYTVLSQLYRTVTECWDPEPEARLTADCVLERINTLLDLLKRYSQTDDNS